MTIVVDEEMCIGCGLCAETCPDVFRMTSGGVAEAYAEVSPDLSGCAGDAQENCPVSAIHLEE